MKKKITRLLMGLVFLAGLSLLLYPFVSNKWNEYRQSQLIETYEKSVLEQAEENNIDLEAERARAQAYNDTIEPGALTDSFAWAAVQEEPNEEYMACLNLADDGIMGYVEIPKIDIRLAVYHTTDEKVLETAAGHQEGSSLPIGGSGTHAVISAHRGLPNAKLFTDLDKVEEGDQFLLYVLDEVLCYEVDQISVVEPKDTELMQVVPGEDYVTLFTCTPYGVNSHRLLVRGHRVEYVEEEVLQEDVELFDEEADSNYLLWVVLGLLVTGTVIILLGSREKNVRREDEDQNEKNDN